MRRALVSCLILGLAALAPAAARAGTVSVNYNVDVGPLTMTVVKLNIDLTGEAAHAKARIRSNGVSRMLSEYSAVAEAESRLGDSAPQPVSFRLVRENADERKQTTLTWNGGSVSYDPPVKNAERRARLESAIAGDVTDPVTALLRIGTAGENPCTAAHEVFDGRDVFELALSDKGRGKSSGDAAWRGEVQHCDVRWTPIAGRAKDKNVPGDSYDVEFAPVAKLPSGQTLWLPVRMSGKIKGMGFTAYATKVSGNGE